jgi:hypothetical protein
MPSCNSNSPEKRMTKPDPIPADEDPELKDPADPEPIGEPPTAPTAPTAPVEPVAPVAPADVVAAGCPLVAVSAGLA